MKRGDLVIVADKGDYGKARPAVIIQSDELNETHPSLLVCLLTTHPADAARIRIPIEPSPDNGLRSVSHIMIDKIVTMPREKVGKVIGHVGADVIPLIDRGLAMVCGLRQSAK